MSKAVVITIGLILSFVLGHFLARANPIEIDAAMIRDTVSLCDDNEGLRNVKVDRYPPTDG